MTTSTDEEITGLADRARAAQERWARVPIRERARLLLRFHDRILENESQVLNTIQSETGKSRQDAFGELYSLAGTARYYAFHGPGHLQEQHVRGALPGVTGARLGWRPHRLVGLITPWNYPFLLSIGDALPALLAGCGVLVKPSERTPLSAILGLQFLCEAGLDPDLVGLVQGGGTQGENVIGEVDYLAFTGSGKTGRKVAVACAHRMIGCSLELGGKNPMVVLEGSPIGNVVEALVAGACANAGQACIGVERVYVAASLHDEFLHKASERFRSLKVGWSTDWTIDLGSLISPDHLEKVYGHVTDAVEKGARVVTGGRKRPDLGPAFIDPTVLTDVSEDAMASREETFGPVISVYPV